MEARTGREKQVYDSNNVRQVAGCVPINPQTGQILLISRTKRENQWILPKGGWESDETKEEAAMRETYEEAGLRGRITGFLGTWDQYKKMRKNVVVTDGRPAAVFWLYEMEVDELLEKWPEDTKRTRKWFPYDEAIAALDTMPFMQEAIRRSSISAARQQQLQAPATSEKPVTIAEPAPRTPEKPSQGGKRLSKTPNMPSRLWFRNLISCGLFA
ncbi:NUDIX hydrolase domain-like protein [Jimgerdemannia flammicorona]|uniref:NUDIX hydrolase domain-like protein n=2 Tax=Jimgerdemannia flammicorona TaxID=994334 RepID=A0A433DIK9_9FUNG|nr:NUDIX hydrolase domain-like protein [Jimgerdemannia flammicorona]RUS33318.1 NUDIX hydrolase domain-like protein [Jimgerdemannia flammicorona]